MKFYGSYSIRHLFLYVYAIEQILYKCSHCLPCPFPMKHCPSHDIPLEGEIGEGKERPSKIFTGKKFCGLVDFKCLHPESEKNKVLWFEIPGLR